MRMVVTLQLVSGRDVRLMPRRARNPNAAVTLSHAVDAGLLLRDTHSGMPVVGSHLETEHDRYDPNCR